jgi:hypothetical protein
MIATAKPAPREHNLPDWHERFLEMLPAIQRHARIAFRHLDPEARADAIQEVLANAMTAFVRLVELGQTDLAYPTPLAMFAVRQFRAGRRVGTQSNANDVGSPYAQAVKGIHVERLDHRDKETGEWREILLECPGVGPAETAAARIDFADWLGSLSRRYRKIATNLATGETTKRAARRFRVSPGRISQIRGELKRCWEQFQGEPETPVAVA